MSRSAVTTLDALGRVRLDQETHRLRCAPPSRRKGYWVRVGQIPVLNGRRGRDTKDRHWGCYKALAFRRPWALLLLPNRSTHRTSLGPVSCQAAAPGYGAVGRCCVVV